MYIEVGGGGWAAKLRLWVLVWELRGGLWVCLSFHLWIIRGYLKLRNLNFEVYPGMFNVCLTGLHTPQPSERESDCWQRPSVRWWMFPRASRRGPDQALQRVWCTCLGPLLTHSSLKDWVESYDNNNKSWLRFHTHTIANADKSRRE